MFLSGVWCRYHYNSPQSDHAIRLTVSYLLARELSYSTDMHLGLTKSVES